MPEHWIRLRAAWEWHAPGASSGPRRVDLPAPGFPGGSLLVRAFQRPSIDPRRETLWLRLDDTPGLASVALNGRVLTRDPGPGRTLRLPIDSDLPMHNRLLLELRPDWPGPPEPGVESAAGPAPPPPSWGLVALVVVRSDAPDSESGPAPDPAG